MNRWGFFFFLFSPQYFYWSAKASQVCAISQCQRLSVRLIQLRLRQLQRARVTGVSLIFPIALVPFVFSARVSLPAACSRKTINWEKATVVHLFEVMSKYVAHFGVKNYPPLCVCVCVALPIFMYICKFCIRELVCTSACDDCQQLYKCSAQKAFYKACFHM